jgi:tRNA threonylcarbamoyladenosine biosynthesis protein TsaB
VTWLALDTATDRATVALGNSPGDALEESVTGARRHAAALIPMIDRLLARANIGLEGVSGIALSDGPGSFTGLRVGAATAKALARARGLPMHVAPSLMVRAAARAEPGATVLAVANALRGELYAAAYRFERAGIRTLLAPAVWRVGVLLAHAPRPDHIIGDGPPEGLRLLAEWAERDVIGGEQSLPRASLLLELLRRPGGARPVTNLEFWEPEYGRPAEAQARWELAHGRPLPDSVGSPG